MWKWLVVAIALMGGCGNSTGTQISNGDMTISLGSPDASMTPDLGLGFCKGTTVEGTCAQSYFTGVAACWNAAGACTQMMDASATTLCWASGARTVIGSYQMGVVPVTWAMNGMTCMTGNGSLSKGGNGMSFKYDLMAGGQHLVFDDGTGDVTCADGSSVNIGANEGGCAALHQIFHPGTMGGCTMGACP